MKTWLLITLGCIIVSVLPALAQAPEGVDGPYVFYEDDGLMARWVEEGALKEGLLASDEAVAFPAAMEPYFQEKYLYDDTALKPRQQISFEGVECVLAVSDIHGQYELLRQLLNVHGVIDEAGNWSFGESHLVVLGDIFDRGDRVTELLWLVHKLERQAEQVGGRVHFLLGNHEVMALQGDLRYVNTKYRYTMALMEKNYNKLFGEDTYLGKWLRTKPVAITINQVAYVHAGISEKVLEQGLSFRDMNAAFQQEILRKDEAAITADPILNLLYQEEGPVWYRGYFEKDFTKKQAKKILRRIGKKHIVVGHTSFEHIRPLYRGRIYGIDSSIKLGEDGELLLVEGRKFYKGTLAGEKVRLR